MSVLTLEQRIVGRAVTFTPTHGDTHHGVIVRASYSTLGEAVLIIYVDDNPVGVGTNTVLIGPDADAVITECDSALTGP